MSIPSEAMSAIHHPDSGPARAAEPVTPGEAQMHALMAREPDSWPEVLRESTGLAGAVDSLSRAVEDLRDRTSHIVRPPGPDTISAVPPHPYPVDTPVGRQLRDVYEVAVSAERRVRDLIERLAV